MATKLGQAFEFILLFVYDFNTLGLYPVFGLTPRKQAGYTIQHQGASKVALTAAV
jgi:hypothetical protein